MRVEGARLLSGWRAEAARHAAFAAANERAARIPNKKEAYVFHVDQNGAIEFEEKAAVV